MNTSYSGFDQILYLINYLVLLVALNLVFVHGSRFIRGSFRWKPPRVRDVSQERIPQPPSVATTEQILLSMDYQPLGVVLTRLGILPQQVYEWLYRSTDGHVYVEVVSINKLNPLLLQFMTIFADDAMIITGYPYGENIITPNFQSRFATTSIEAAHRFHLEQIAAWQRTHGDVQPVLSVADVLKTDYMYHLRYRRQQFRRSTIIHLTQTVFYVVIAVLSGVVVFIFWQNLLQSSMLHATLLALIWIAVVVINNRYNRVIRNLPNAIDASPSTVS